MSKKPENPEPKDLADAELEQVSGGGKLLGDDIGVPVKKGGTLKEGLSKGSNFRRHEDPLE